MIPDSLIKLSNHRRTELYSKFLFSGILCILILASSAHSADWPTYLSDNQRSAMTSEQLPETLSEQWCYTARHQPLPAWPGPAKTDYWHREANLKPRVIYDRAYHVVSDGNKIYFGSSANDKLTCLNASTGAEVWSFFAGGPIRLAPTLFQNRVYVGADDGFVYCLDGTNGALVWKFDAAENARLLPGNERLMSIHPVRTGILIEDGIAYFFAGMFPNEGVTLFALDALSGRPIWSKPEQSLSPQGYLLASKTKLFVPTGRTTPVAFRRADGQPIGQFKGNGGTYAILNDETLLYGGGDLGELEIRQPESKEQIATFNGVRFNNQFQQTIQIVYRRYPVGNLS